MPVVAADERRPEAPLPEPPVRAAQPVLILIWFYERTSDYLFAAGQASLAPAHTALFKQVLHCHTGVTWDGSVPFGQKRRPRRL